MTEITVTRLRDEHRDDVVALILAQESRQHALDPCLRAPRTRQEIITALTIQHESGEQPLIALDTNGRVRGYTRPGVWELSETSILRAFLSLHNGVARHLTLPDPQEQDARAVATALLARLSDIWQSQHTSGDLIRWPSADRWLEPILAEQGFRLDSVCAMRATQPESSTRRVSSSQVVIRKALPTDEKKLVALLDEELRYHERYTRFVHSSPEVLAAFRRKLARLWNGASLQEGAPLLLVAERESEIVAMAENTLLVLDADDEPGFTSPGRYGCIDNVSVREELRGQGIGRLLLQAVFDAFAATGLQLDGYVLWYNPDNPQAGRFWPHLGFQSLWTTYQRLYTTNGLEQKA